jgi:hypothetical protein
MSLCHLCLGGPGDISAPGYGFSVCIGCWRAAKHGWDPTMEATIHSILARAGLPAPDRTPEGRLPRHYILPADHTN